MQLPLQEKWEIVRYAWGNGCRTCSGPQMSNESGSIMPKKTLMNYDILIVLRGPKLPLGWPFPGLTNAAPPPRKLEMIGCAWGDGCTMWSGPQTSNESALTLFDKYFRWIKILWPSSEDQNSPWGDRFQVWQMQLPLPEKLEMIRCAWGDCCRTCSAPQTSNEGASTLSNKYIGWFIIFWPSSEDQNSPRGNPFQVWQMQLPLPEKWEMVRCAWGLGCRTCSAPQTSNGVHQKCKNEHNRWIMIFSPSSEDQNSPWSNPFKIWKRQLPLPEKWEMIRCACKDGCRMYSGPQTYNISASTLSNKYIGQFMIFWPSSEDQKLPQGNSFKDWQMQLPLPEKWEMVRYAWGNGCRMCSGHQMSNENASTLSDEYFRWIMILWPSSEDRNSPWGDPFQVWQMQLPLQEKWEMIRCALGDGCRTWSGPQTSNESASTLSNKYIGWFMIFWPSSEDQNLSRGNPFQVW